MGKPGFFTAEQLATRFDLAPSSIRLYAARGLLRPIYLNDGVFFTAGDFIRLEVIQKGKRLGFSLPEIGRLMEGVRRPD